LTTNTFDDLIHEALKNGESVEVRLADGYGYRFVIGDLTVPEEGEAGLPHEMFCNPLSYFGNSEELENRVEVLREMNTEEVK
jgi:hypothetical protein